MNQEKKHHHFVPQVYLKKFHHTKVTQGKKDKYFVAIYDKIDKELKGQINVRDICAKKKLYTIDSSDIRVRESIENFYSETLENDYNKFYNIITNPQKDILNLKERELIITSVVNLHLRNYFWLKLFNDFWISVINRYPEGFSEKVFDEKNRLLLDFSSKTRNQIIDKERKSNKQLFIKSHLEHTLKWTKYHFHDLIIVDTAPDNSIYITSDKPVIAGKINDSLRIAVDSKHMITLLPPPSIKDRDDYKIFRKTDLINTNITNLLHYENAERMVIGSNLEIIEKAKINYEKATIN